MAISIGIGNYIRSSPYRGTNGTPNPVFALNFDNFAYKAVDYPDFATGKVTTNKIVLNSTTETFNGAIALAKDPEADTGDPIEVPSYKIKVTGLNQYSVGEGNWAVGLMGMIIDSTKEPWTYLISKDGVYDIPEISLLNSSEWVKTEENGAQ